MEKISRRDFLKQASLASAGLMVGVGISNKSYGNIMGANDQMRVAVAGVNGRGKNHIDGYSKVPNCQVVALVDVDLNVANEQQKRIKDTYKKDVQVYQDFRKALENKDIDCVSLATPNHWHALQTVWACQAGKHVYVEKPATHNVAEGRKIIEAAYKYNRIVQHGVQLRSSTAIREAVQLLRDGVIGNVYMARGLVYRWRPSVGYQGISAVPAGLDYDMWSGPAPMRPFSKDLVPYNWHWHWDYGNGDVGNQGIHETDLCLWGLGVDTLPEKITSMGGKFLWDDAKEVPEVQTSIYHYPSQKKIIQFEVRNWCTNLEDGAGVGNIFYGDKGYMVIRGYDTYDTYLGEKREKGPSGKAGGDHFQNFIDSCRANDKSMQHGPVETAHLASALAHLGNIAYRVDAVLNFDPVAEKFIGNEDANRMLTREYRAPYVMPAQV